MTTQASSDAKKTNTLIFAHPTKRWLASLLLALGALVTAGCSSTRQEAVAAPVSEVVAAPPPPSGAPAMDAREAFAPTSPGVAPARNRPGLGTEWGEERLSAIEDVPFKRADERRPLATTELRYDDARGVDALAQHVSSRTGNGHETFIAGGAITIWLKDGRDVPLDVVQIAQETFVVGEAGERYTIVLENHTAHRYEAVTSVDGLDVINGKPGSIGSRGYLLMPYATLEIDGFRQSTSTVAAFRFGRVAESYAAKVGTARDVGVIGVALFGEQGDRWPTWTTDDVRTRESAHPFPADTRFAQPPRW